MIQSSRIQQLGSAVVDIQRKLNHEIKEREIDENALSNRYENLPKDFSTPFFCRFVVCTTYFGLDLD